MAAGLRILLSPAKKMNSDTDGLACEGLPQFLGEAENLLRHLKRMSFAELKALWCCNDVITALNYERVQRMDLHHDLTPAILSYEGIQYQYMAPGVFEKDQLRYIREHLRILSGFYGLLRPFDGVVPYRLEMQARLGTEGCKDLYSYWGDKPAGQLLAETDFILNLASKEYSRAVSPYIPQSALFLTCTFGEWKAGRVIEKGTLCKMARGEMVRWLAEQNITDSESIKGFNRLGYAYHEERSDLKHYVFVKEQVDNSGEWQ